LRARLQARRAHRQCPHRRLRRPSRVALSPIHIAA
jgi:hypothetical protein